MKKGFYFSLLILFFTVSCKKEQTTLDLQKENTEQAVSKSSNNWHQKGNFKYKEMSYWQSCFPCCMQMALTNMGYYGKENTIEDAWNRMQIKNGKPELNRRAPDEYDVHRNFSNTDLRGCRTAKLFTPSMFNSRSNAEAVARELRSKFATGQYRSMIIGIGHAHFIYNAGGKFYYVHPAPDAESTDVVEFSNVKIEVLESTDAYGNVECAISVGGSKGTLVAGNYIAVLN